MTSPGCGCCVTVGLRTCKCVTNYRVIEHWAGGGLEYILESSGGYERRSLSSSYRINM